MLIRKRLGTVVVAVGLWVGSASPGFAADTATVDAEVSIVAPCLTVSTPSIDFGQMLLSRPDNPWSAARQISYSDCSGFGEFIYGRGTDATETGGGTGSWQLTGSSLDCADLGPNQFRLYARSTQTNQEITLVSVDQQLEHVGPDAQGTINEVQLITPCTGSAGVGSTMSFQFILTASF